MGRMKLLRLSTIITALVLLITGCEPLVSDDDRVLSVYATFYPIYVLTDALTRNVPNLELHCLVQPQDGCLRAYQLSDWDAYLLATSADAVIAGGRGLESFESALFGMGDSGPAITAVLYNLELYNKSPSHAATDDESHLEGANPHLYLSISGAGMIVEAIGAMLMTLDPEYSETYASNEATALEVLDELETKTKAAMASYSGRSVILMNEALIYVAKDYGLKIADWVDRESGDMLYDAELDECLNGLKDAGTDVILIERQAPAALVESLEDAGYSVARLDILSTHREGEGFETYVDVQRNNAAAIQQAFEAAGKREGEH